MTDFDVVIIGAGVVGLACGYSLTQRGLSVAVIEAEKAIASITSARNSEVIHAGLYYPKNSLKHLLCLRGRHLLYQFVKERHIAHKKCGKVVVATNVDEQHKIEALYQQAQSNGVENIHLLTAQQLTEYEPQISGVGGLFSGETGIIDAHSFCHMLAQHIEESGSIVAINTPFLQAEPRAYGFDITIGGSEAATLSTRFLINSAGLNAAQVARRVQGLAKTFCPNLVYAKGSYFSMTGKSPFSHLVYPAPVEGGLGVHATLDLAGRLRFGPDVEWLEQFPKSVKRFSGKNCGKNKGLERQTSLSEVKTALEVSDADELIFDYQVDAARSDNFYAAIRRYWPGLPKDSLSPDYSGIRPKLSGRGALATDFVIDDEMRHGVRGLINLFGIESPGLTSSLAIGEEVSRRIHFFS